MRLVRFVNVCNVLSELFDIPLSPPPQLTRAVGRDRSIALIEEQLSESASDQLLI